MPTKRAPARGAYELSVQRFLQPDDVTCGPTCLRKVYHFYGLNVPLETLSAEVERHEDGGTLAVHLGISALRRGFRARIFSYNHRIFDPTWVGLSMEELAEKLRQRLPHLRQQKPKRAGEAYLHFVEQGGEVAFDELSPKLLKGILNRDHPVLAGLSATHLYRMPRERQQPGSQQLVDDDVGGDPVGHFVVISGYGGHGRRFTVRDPSAHIPSTPDGRLQVEAQRLINSILLGDLTYDAVLLELWLPERAGGRP